MAEQPRRLAGHAQLVLVIAAKDITEAVTNTTILAIVIGTFMTLLIGQALPLILQLRGIHVIAVYEEDDAGITASLRSMEGVRVLPARSPEMVVEMVREASSPMLGVIIPADVFDNTTAGELSLEGYLPAWTGRADASALVSFFEQKLEESCGLPVSIHTIGNMVAPAAESGGRPGMATISIVMVVVCIGLFLIPYLLTEERELHTMDALMVSPASTAHIVIGKVVAGISLGAVAGAIALGVNAQMMIHWPLAILSVACGVLFMAALGLLMGSLFESMSSMGLVVGMLIILLLMPLVFASNMPAQWPAFIRQAIDWMPSVSMGRVLRMSMTPAVDAGSAVGRLGSLVALAAVLLVLTAARVRASDR